MKYNWPATPPFHPQQRQRLKAKIRVKLLANREFQGSKVKIVVEDRVVFIMGQLTRKEAQLATETVASTEGIEKWCG